MPEIRYRDLIPYDPPNATDADRADVYRLLGLRKLKLSKAEREKLIAARRPVPVPLEDLVKDHDPERKRFVMRVKGALHNEEYLISIYMDHIGRPEAVPDSWRTPTPHTLGVAWKIRKPTSAPAPHPARAEGETLQFDPLDTSRYVAMSQRGVHLSNITAFTETCMLCRMSLAEKAEGNSRAHTLHGHQALERLQHQHGRGEGRAPVYIPEALQKIEQRQEQQQCHYCPQSL